MRNNRNWLWITILFFGIGMCLGLSTRAQIKDEKTENSNQTSEIIDQRIENNKVKDKTEDKEKIVVNYKDDRLSLSVEDVDIKDVLKKIGDITGIDIVIGKDIEGKVKKIQFEELSIEEAMEKLFGGKGSGIVVEYSNDKVKKVMLTKNNSQINERDGKDLKKGLSEEEIKILRQKRAEIFKMMGWEEGKYLNDKEKEISKKFTDPNDEYREVYVIYPGLMLIGEGDTDYIRPLTEFIFDPNNQMESRIAAVRKLGYISDKKAIPIIKMLLDENDLEIKKGAIEGLYYCGDKKAAFEEMVKLNKEGSPYTIYSLKEHRPFFDPEAKKYLLEIVDIGNDESKILSAEYLLMIDEDNTAEKIVKDIKNKLDKGFYDSKPETKDKIIRHLKNYSKVKKYKKKGDIHEKQN